MHLLNHLLVWLSLLWNAFALTAPETISDNFDNRIIGGTGVIEGQYPSMVSLQTPSQRHFCGGSIISSRWILTAAHCVFDRKLTDIRVRSGTIRHNTGGVFNLVNQIRVHDHFVNEVNRYNDIAALQISGQFNVNQMTRPITLDTSTSLGLTGAVALGWGRTAVYDATLPSVLQSIDTITLQDAVCRQQAAIPIIQRVQICTLAAAGLGICTGDTGGPLIVDGRLVGIASSAVPCAIGRPDVYTRVSAFASWITQITINPVNN